MTSANHSQAGLKLAPKARRLGGLKALAQCAQGGSEFVETLVLIAFVALAAIVGVAAFKGTLETKFDEGAPSESRPMSVGDLDG